MSTDFGHEINAIAAMVEPPDIEVHPEAIAIATQSLGEIDDKYGSESENPLSFHNAGHTLGMTRRVVRLTNLLYPFIPPKYQEGIYDLGIVGGSTHDWEQGLGPSANEQASSEYAAAQVEAEGGPLNSDLFKTRLDLGIQATAVQFAEGGELVQAQLQRGKPDPFKFIMGFGDINGIAMEGPFRMTKDATNLYYEITQDPTVLGLLQFLADQEVFLSRRLGDWRMKADIAYHFPDSINEVYGAMHNAYHKNIVAAHGLALLLGQSPELEATLGAVVNTSAEVLDRSLLGDVVTKVVRRHVRMG